MRLLISDFLKTLGNKPPAEMYDRFNTRTNSHIDKVRKNLAILSDKFPSLDKGKMKAVGMGHDKSKFEQEEVIPYVWMQAWYENDRDDNIYPEGMKDQVGEAIKHHVGGNRHHPEFHKDISGMSQYDIVEMVSDWAAMAEEKKNSLKTWAEKMKEKWKFNPNQINLINKFVDVFEPRV